ncbi:MAG: right-handed parallel beta-helix repeat-containing protein [Pirellulales bacterium]|nr:right-handed parallel beta-helix repeat-containing protein [Pirellulales bacterium]
MASNLPKRRRAPSPLAGKRRQRRPAQRRLAYEPLEPRRLLAVFTVDADSDLVDLADGRMSLREAVIAANLQPGNDEIRFDFGHSDPLTIALTGGELAVADSVSIVGPGAQRLTIDAQHASRIFNATGPLTLSGLTLTRGRTAGDNLPAEAAPDSTYSGAAVYAAAALTLDGVTITGSHAEGANTAGGGVFAAAELSISNSVIRGNTAGAVNSTGGGVAALGAAIIQTTTIAGNRASRGGGVSASGSLRLLASTIDNNAAVDPLEAAGGGVYSTGSFDAVSVTISTNAARVTGQDARAHGGGMWLAGPSRIAHSTIAVNTATSVGPGAVASGGGLFASLSPSAALEIDHTIVAGNLTSEGEPEMRIVGAPLTVRYSLIADNAGSPLAEAPVGWPDPQGNLIGGVEYGYLDPGIGGLEDNGGPTRTHALLNGSPAIFAGDPSLTPGLADTPLYDQRGGPYVRLNGTRIDLGAVEYQANVHIVDSLADEDDQRYGAGDFTLREALRLANERPGVDFIEFDPALFAAGPATISLTLGELTITDSMELHGPGSGLLTIDARGIDRYTHRPGGGAPVFTVDDGLFGVSAVVYMSGLTLTGGDPGGIKYNEALVLTDIQVIGSHADITLEGSDGIRSASRAGSLLWMRACRVADTRNTYGVQALGALYVERSVITGNVGGIYAARIAPTDEVVISHTAITDNVRPRGTGGIYAEGLFAFTMFSTVVSGNTGLEVGGVGLRDVLEVLITDSSIADNMGTGVRIIDNRVLGAIRNSTISRNVAWGRGGGFDVQGTLSVEHCTITDNVAEQFGDGIDARGGIAGGYVALSHSIVAGNTAGASRQPSDLAALPLQSHHNFIGYLTSPSLAETLPGAPDANGNFVGGPSFGPIDPRLGPLADNGGPQLPGGARLLTHLPLAGSAVIDAGDPSFAPGDADAPLYDQRGAFFPRIFGARVDIGAVERHGVPLVVDTLTDESDGNFASGDLSLREAIELANAQPGHDLIQFAANLAAPSPGVIFLTQGELVVNESLTILGPPAGQLTIDSSSSDPTPSEQRGDGARLFRIEPAPAKHDSPGPPPAVRLTNLTLVGGDAPGDGGAITAVGDLDLDNMHFAANAAAGSGGAISAVGSAHIVNSTFADNQALGGSGGAIWITGDLVLRDSQFDGNRAAMRGGAIALTDRSARQPSTALIDSSALRANEAGAAGGGVAWSDWTSVVIVNSLIRSNEIANRFHTPAEGAGLYGAGPLVLAHSTIAFNGAQLPYLLRGGGIRVK